MCIVNLRTILRLLQRKSSTFPCCLVKKESALKVALQFAIRGLVAYKKKSVYQLNDILSHNPDRKTQSLCCLVPIVKTKFIAVMGFVACFN